MRYPNKRGENISMNDEQKEFIKNLAVGISDNRIAADLGISVGVVNYYRRQILGIVKQSGRHIKIIRDKRNRFQIARELEAIQQFANYPSLMNGAKDRVKYLESVLNNIR